MRPSLSVLRPLSILLAALRRRAGRATAWLPWLGVALLVAAVLSPGAVTASQLMFQSPPADTPIPPTPVPPPPPTPTPPPPPPPTSTPVPPAPPTPTEVVPTEAPAEAPPPAETVATEESPPAEGQPAQEMPLPPTEATEAPAALPEAAPPVQATEMPVTSPSLEAEQASGVEADQPIINWVKFWDTIAVTVAYPWLCCGVGLLLLVPVFLLFLEIKGRRSPPIPPEILAAEERGYEE